MKCAFCRSAAAVVSLVILSHCGASHAGSVSDWEASSGKLPTQIAPPYGLDTAGTFSTILNPGFLSVSTTGDSSLAFYAQYGPTVDTSGSFYVQAGVKIVSDSSSFDAREAAAIFITTAPGVGNVLYIGDGRVFLLASGNVRGDTALVPTTDGFHNYELDVAANGALTVFYDGTEILTGQTFSSESNNGDQERVGWGDLSVFASGTSDWSYVRHDALAASVPEPSTLILFGIAAGSLAVFKRRIRVAG
jgi:hypothetical protein